MSTVTVELLPAVAALMLIAAVGTLCARLFIAASRSQSGPAEDG